MKRTSNRNSAVDVPMITIGSIITWKSIETSQIFEKMFDATTRNLCTNSAHCSHESHTSFTPTDDMMNTLAHIPECHQFFFNSIWADVTIVCVEWSQMIRL